MPPRAPSSASSRRFAIRRTGSFTPPRSRFVNWATKSRAKSVRRSNRRWRRRAERARATTRPGERSPRRGWGAGRGEAGGGGAGLGEPSKGDNKAGSETKLKALGEASAGMAQRLYANQQG